MTMTRPAPRDSPRTSPSSSANAGAASRRTGASAAPRTVNMRTVTIRRLTAQKLSNGVAQISGEALETRVGEQFLQQQRSAGLVRDRQPPVRVVVDGARQVGLAQVAYGVAGRGNHVPAGGPRDEPV